ncbi:Hpt domain-containing protein [Lamprobacter modestohalophilus]|nr:Hpt domain-containing protein [Lamprobacter modestohalophilus]MEA1052041.1 Hpt domain-containing protein [Lamprobacter modestohalophilus]
MDVHERLVGLLADQQVEAAKELLHTLKGVTANLAIREIPELSNAIEQKLKGGELKLAEPLERLGNALERLQEDLRLLDDWGAATEQPADEGAEQAVDVPRALALLEHVIPGLEQAQLIDRETLDGLAVALGRQRYAPLEERLEAYEMEEAAELAKQLRDALEGSVSRSS